MKPENTAVIGLQTGDEGKGKIVDILSGAAFDYVVRYQGGHNAGHTVQIGDQTYKLHIFPSGILRPRMKCILGGGMVIDPLAATRELSELGLGDPGERLMISDRATLLIPWHPVIEAENAKHYGKGGIGSTGRGIGPAYEDNVGRRAFKTWELDVMRPNGLARFKERVWDEWKVQVERRIAVSALTINEFLLACERLVPYIRDTRRELCQHIVGVEATRSALFEGAQGHVLDLDHGTYPFVTSSNTTVGGICTGTGVPAKAITHVLGVVKAYATRVGNGPFPTEDKGHDGEHMLRVGREQGTTTGRDRRCGWFDGVQVREAVMYNGVDALAVMKIDVLTGLHVINICIGYKRDGNWINYLPADPEELARCEPQYATVLGWTEDITGVRCWQDLPAAAQRLLEVISNRSGAPIKLVSVGPERSQVLLNPSCKAFPWIDELLAVQV